MLSMFVLLLPLALIVLISLPLIKVFKGKTSIKSTKVRMVTHVALFFVVAIGCVVFSGYNAYAAEANAAVEGIDQMTGSIGQGLGFLAAALATGLSALGAGIAVAGAAPAAIGAFSENEKNFGKSMIFVAMGEGVAIYGLIISILILFMKM